MEKRIRRGREFWTKVVAAYEASGGKENHNAFAARHGVRRESFERWLYRTRAEKSGRRWAGKSGRAPSLKPAALSLVSLPSAFVGDSRFEIELPTGIRLRLSAPVDVETLRRVLVVLAEKPAS